MGSRVDYDAPGHSSTTMTYSADGTRLFSCGTNKEGDSYIVVWNESEGAVKRTYIGLGKRSVGVVQFDTTKNRFLVAGDEYMVKYWDMDNVNLLATADAEGGLQASPCIIFNKEGILLAVSTNDNGIKILANTDGIRLLQTVESRSFDTSRISSAAIVKPPAMGAFGAFGRNCLLPSISVSLMAWILNMSAAKLIGSVAASFVIAFTCDYYIAERKIFGGTTPSTITNKEWQQRQLTKSSRHGLVLLVLIQLIICFFLFLPACSVTCMNCSTAGAVTGAITTPLDEHFLGEHSSNLY